MLFRGAFNHDLTKLLLALLSYHACRVDQKITGHTAGVLTRVTALKVLRIIRPFDNIGVDRLDRGADMLESIRP